MFGNNHDKQIAKLSIDSQIQREMIEALKIRVEQLEFNTVFHGD